MRLGCNALFTQFIAPAWVLLVLGCGGGAFSGIDQQTDAGVQPDATDAGSDHATKDAAKPETGHDAKPESEASDDDAAQSDVAIDAPEEPPTGICATHGHDGAILVHPIMTLGPSAFLTVYGDLSYMAVGDAGVVATPFEGWCWSESGGQGEFDCFPTLLGDEAPATPGAKITIQIGTNQTGSGPPSFYFCEFGVCPVTVVICAGKVQACSWTNGKADGDIIYKEPGHNGKGELICTLP